MAMGFAFYLWQNANPIAISAELELRGELHRSAAWDKRVASRE